MTIDEYIKESGYKKNHIAKVLGMKMPTLANKISGKRLWKVDEIKKLAELIGVPVGELVDAAVRRE